MNDFDPSGAAKKSSGPARIALLLCVAWLLTGAIFKLYRGSPNDLPPTVVEMSPFNLYDTFRGAIAVELCIAALALFWPRIGWFFVAALFAVFLGILGKLMAAGAESCGCLGSSVTLKPWHMMAIDGTLLLLLLASKPWSRFQKAGKPFLRMGVLAPLFAIAFFLPWTKFQPVDLGPVAGGNQGTGSEQSPEGNQGSIPPTNPAPVKGDFYEFKIEQWEGQMWFDLDLLRFANPVGSMDALPAPAHVVLYRKTCEHCKEHIEELALNPPADQSIVLLRIPEIDDANAPNVIELKPAGAIEVEIQALKRGYAIHTPSSFDIDETFMVTNVTEIQHEDE